MPEPENATAAHEREFPKMPKDYWPEELVISIKDGSRCVSCPVMDHDRDKIQFVVDTLRLAMWQATHWKIEGK
jgi:hypothetical protein